MQVLVERACGLDVHKKTITACIVTPEGKEIKTFHTHTVYLLQLIDWMKEHRCTHVAMESTSYIPDRNQRELRELVRYRRSLIQERAREHNRVQKVLEGANIKLAAVATDIMGLSSRDMMNEMINGEEYPEKLASFERGVMKKKNEDLELALRVR